MSIRRPWAWPLVPLYSGALAAKEALCASGLAQPKHLGWPVVSVGSLSAGGAGKTPVTIALANLLTERGWSVDVLSRGYRRAGRGVEQVDLRAPDPALQFGDEPTLIARRTGVPVWVGSDRFAAGAAAERNSGKRNPAPAAEVDFSPVASAGEPELDPHSVPFVISGLRTEAEAEPGTGPEIEPGTAPRVHLLDDGLQHRGLERSFELILVTLDDLSDALLPAGNLREPFSALRRADALAVREDEVGRLTGPLRRLVGREIPLWTVRRTLRFPAPLGVFGAGLRPLAFCGIARPENFAASLAKSGCGVVDTAVFPDHHRYTERDILELIRLAKKMDASGFITTEKDAVKLHSAIAARLADEIGPLVVPALDAAFVYESPVVRALSSRLESPASTRAEGRRDEVRSR